ncbi:MAG: glutathione S-transferase [Robiginitomaculum sp.]|nr:MAG: glutathione S-transferase [Robiginitomaculum sp.]
MKLYDYCASGNGYKARLLLSWLGEAHEYIEINIHEGETHTPEFLAMNPAGQIPVLILEDGRCLAESNAILFYLGLGSSYLPPDAFTQAEILRWMFFEQYKHEPAIAVARFITVYAPKRKKELPALIKRGYAALDIMETHLSTRDYFVGDGLTIADISLYGYTHVATEGGFDMKPYKFIKKWLKRVKDHPDYVSIKKPPK